jgi:CPA2 family monovalent cation:H+ antiporter-2
MIPASFCDLSLHIPDMEVTTFLTKPGSWADGKTLAEMALRKKYGVTAMAVRHQGQTRPNPDGDTRLAAQDLVVVMRDPERLIDPGKNRRITGHGTGTRPAAFESDR